MSIYAYRIEVAYKTFELRSNILQPMLSTSFHILPTPKIGRLILLPWLRKV